MKSIRSAIITCKLIEDSIYDCFRHKYSRNDVCKFIASYSGGLLTPQLVKAAMHEDYGHDAIYQCIHKMTLEYYDEIENHNISFEPLVSKEIIDGASGKHRIISTESIKQQIFDYICVNMMQPIFRNRLGRYQCASIPNRGQIYALNAINKWKQNTYKTRYFIKTDIVDYFHSIDHDKLLRMIWKYTQNTQLMEILEIILNTYERGLSIGSYLSQYLANLFLSDVYRSITENYPMTYHILIYMDDILIFTHTKRNAKYVLDVLTDMLEYKGLSIHNTIVSKFDYGTNIDMVGYKIYRDHATIRRRNYKRICCKIRSTKHKRFKMTNAFSIISYNGILVHCNSIKLIQRYNFDRIFSKSLSAVSNRQRSVFY